MSGSSVFPAPSSPAVYSSQPPVNASSVLLDGQLITSSGFATTITGTGGALYVYANGASTPTITINGTVVTTITGAVVATNSTYSGVVNISISGTTRPIAFGIYDGPVKTY